MQYKGLLGSITTEGYCISALGFYLVLCGFQCQKSAQWINQLIIFLAYMDLGINLHTQFIVVTDWISATIILIGFVNNSLVLVTLLKKHHWRKRLSFVYLVQMAIFDIISGGIRSGHLLSSRVDNECTKVESFTLGLCSGVITFPVWLLVAMVTERTIAIINPIKARIFFTVKSNIIQASCLSILLLSFSALPVIMDAYQKNGVCIIKDEFHVLAIIWPIVYSFLPFICDLCL